MGRDKSVMFTVKFEFKFYNMTDGPTDPSIDSTKPNPYLFDHIHLVD